MTTYLQDEWQWRRVQLSGRIRRSRTACDQSTWESQETWTWVSSLSPTEETPERLA